MIEHPTARPHSLFWTTLLLLASPGLGCRGSSTPDAATVSYDPATSQLGRSSVQAALDELAARLALESSQLTAVQETVTGHTTQLATTKTPDAKAVAFDDGTAKLSAKTVQAAIEAVATRASTAQKSADAGTAQATSLGSSTQAKAIAPIAGLAATTVEGALSALVAADSAAATAQTAAMAVLETKLAALESRVGKLETCPPGTVADGWVCLEENVRPKGDWHWAVGVCSVANMRLCTVAELLSACAGATAINTVGPPEWALDLAGPSMAYLADLYDEVKSQQKCFTFTALTTASVTDNMVEHPFRCCRTL